MRLYFVSDVCLAGQYYERDASNVVQCFDCPIGKYNGDTMAVECDDCPGGSTTVLTGSTRIDLCVGKFRMSYCA